MLKKLILAGLLLFPSVAFAECGAYWDVSALTNGAAQHRNLTLNNGMTAKTIPTAWFQQVHAAKRKIDAVSGLYTKLLLCSSGDANAFAYSSSGVNVVMLTFGMYDLIGNDWAAYAALLGHENAHLVHGHSQQRQTREAVIGILGMLAGAVLDAAIEKETGVKGVGLGVAGVTSEAIAASYSREDELEADRSGMMYASRSGFDPNGAMRLHYKISSASDFLSTHPSSQERINVLRTEIALLTTRPQTDNVQVAAANRRRISSLSEPAGVSALSSGSRIRDSEIDLSGKAGSGVVVGVKARLGYFIASQTDFKPAVRGMGVHIITADNKKIFGTVERVVGGYFSVIPSSDIDGAIMGRKVVFQ